MDYRKTAQEILDQVGGSKNIVSAAHCATRLRLVIADNSKADKGAIENIDGVKGVFEASGQLQIILGTGTVNKVFDEFIAIAGITASSKAEAKEAAAQKQNVFMRAIKLLGDIFVPIIPAIVASGFLMGIMNSLDFMINNGFISMDTSSSIYVFANLFSNTAYTFLQILIAFSAAKAFGANPYLGAVIGMIMINPALQNAYTVATEGVQQTQSVFFGLYDIDMVGYQGHVIPVVIAVAPALRVRIPVGKRKFGSVLDGAFACAAISVVTIPVMMLMVGYIPMLAPLCSILVLPLMPVVLTAGIVAGIFGGLLPGRLAGGCLQLLFGYIRAVAAAGGSGPMVPLGGELVKLGVAAALLLLMGLAVICGVRQLSLHRGLVAAMISVLLAVTGLCGVVPRAEGLQISALEGTLILQKGQQAVVIGSGRSDYAGQTVAGYLWANGVQEYHLLIPEGRMTFTGGCYELLGRFAADSILYTQMDTRLQLALEQFAPAEVCPLTGASRWQLFGEAELEIRPGNNGPYLLLHAGEKTLLLCDGKDSPIYQADWTVYYDHQPEESLSSFAENCGILEITELPFEAGEEMPGWEAGFLCPDWTILVEDQLRLLPG